jgi:hypothetical protein
MAYKWVDEVTDYLDISTPEKAKVIIDSLLHCCFPNSEISEENSKDFATMITEECPELLIVPKKAENPKNILWKEPVVTDKVYWEPIDNGDGTFSMIRVLHPIVSEPIPTDTAGPLVRI